ncbi:MAG: hypothetical protein MZV70_29135 [Desulfobacterales bacterium]|nr:hypothetical protein [Desulfobacterales bacterium]
MEDLDTLCYQLTLVQATTTANEGFFKFSSSSKKDRYSALLYGLNAAVELVDQMDVSVVDDGDDYGVVAWEEPQLFARRM